MSEEVTTPIEKPNALSKFVGGLFDSQKRISWRRLSVFFVTTGIFVLTDKLDAQQWVMVALVYIGGDAIEKFAARLGTG